MKHRFVAMFAALAVVTAGALVTPAVEATSPPAAVGAGGAPVQSLVDLPGATDGPAPDRDAPQASLSGAPSKSGSTLDGALASVVEAIVEGDAVPDDLGSQIIVDGDRIRVEVTHTDESSARNAIAAAGGDDVFVITDTLLAADVPADAIESVKAAAAVTAVTLPALLSPAPETGTVPTTVGKNGGDVFTKTAVGQWHKLGVNGAGVSVGIVDYFDRKSWDDARKAGEVPAAAGTFCRWGGLTCNVYDSPSPDVHGIGVAEAIHDMAPKAKLYLATVATNEDLKKAIDYFASKGVKILSRSLGGFYDGAGNGTGPSAKLVDYAVKKGITWFNAAGNSGAYARTFTNGSQTWKAQVGGYWRVKNPRITANGFVEFPHYEVDQTTGVPTGNVTYSDLMQINCSPYFRLRWNDWGDNPTDYDIYRVRNIGTTSSPNWQVDYTPGYSANWQRAKGDKPMELQDGAATYFECTPGEWIYVAIVVDRVGNGTADDVLELQGNSGDIYMTATSPYSAGSAFNDSKNAGMATVGAVDPVDGILIAGYSSQGPTNDGRIKPELSAGSNFTSRAYLGQGGRFNGTSAATPVVAGAAAVVLQRYPSWKPDKLIDFLRKNQTTDRGAAGVDNVYGSGELVMKPLKVAKFTATPKPKITGTRAVGSTLKATTAWKPAVTSASYQWYRGSKAIKGATKVTYKLAKADAGKKIRVKVTGKRGGYTSVTKYSSYTGAVAKVFTKAPKPKITGTVKVGRTLTASVGTWSPKYSKVTYQWKRDGKVIKGATKRTYKLKSADAGKRITVTVKASKKAYKTTSKTSAKSAKVKR